MQVLVCLCSLDRTLPIINEIYSKGGISSSTPNCNSSSNYKSFTLWTSSPASSSSTISLSCTSIPIAETLGSLCIRWRPIEKHRYAREIVYVPKTICRNKPLQLPLADPPGCVLYLPLTAKNRFAVCPIYCTQQNIRYTANYEFLVVSCKFWFVSTVWTELCQSLMKSTHYVVQEIMS